MLLVRKVARLLLWAVIGLVAGAAVVAVWFTAMLSGGFDDLLPRSQPSRDDAEVVTARQAATRAARTTMASLADRLDTLATTAHADRCEAGEHNWKRDDPYDLSCVLTVAAFLPVPEPQRDRSTMSIVVRALRADGWTPEPSPAPGWTRFNRVDGRLEAAVLGRGDSLALYEPDLQPVEDALRRLAPAERAVVVRLDLPYFTG